MNARQVARERLTGVDVTIRGQASHYLSLDPQRSEPEGLASIAAALLAQTPVLSEVTQLAFATALERIALGQLEHFPGNIFWDLKYVAACLLTQAQAGPDAPQALSAWSTRFVALQARFGLHSPIRFRYVHDFIYGFDWQRWVAAEPSTRAGVLPFDAPFLDHIERRGQEILAAIAAGDASFPALEPGTFRNPFAFRRDPEREIELHLELSRRGLIPVAAWRFRPVLQPVGNCSAARLQLARELQGEVPKAFG
ncbi:MAG: ferrochelatase [Myxococcales bacterium]|nr:ferrochelatase [Myxococcales bacterium]